MINGLDLGGSHLIKDFVWLIPIKGLNSLYLETNKFSRNKTNCNFQQNQNELSVNLADLQNVKKRLVQFAEDYGVIDPMRTLYQYFRAQMPPSGLVPNSS